MDKFRSVENQFFEPIVSNETLTSFNEGYNAFDLNKIKAAYMKSSTPTSSISDMDIQAIDDGVTYDDSDVDPNYIPGNEENDSESNESDSSINIMARQIEKNICSASYTNKKQAISKKRNLGHEYVTKKGKRVLGRSTKPLSGTCKLKCSTKISIENQGLIFAEYWGLGNY